MRLVSDPIPKIALAVVGIALLGVIFACRSDMGIPSRKKRRIV